MNDRRRFFQTLAGGIAAMSVVGSHASAQTSGSQVVAPKIYKLSDAELIEYWNREKNGDSLNEYVSRKRGELTRVDVSGIPVNLPYVTHYDDTFEGTILDRVVFKAFEYADPNYRPLTITNLKGCSLIKAAFSKEKGHLYMDEKCDSSFADFTLANIPESYLNGKLTGAIFMGKGAANALKYLLKNPSEEIVCMDTSISEVDRNLLKSKTNHSAVTTVEELAARLENLARAPIDYPEQALKYRNFRLAADHIVNMPEVGTELAVSSGNVERVKAAAALFDKRHPDVSRYLNVESLAYLAPQAEVAATRSR